MGTPGGGLGGSAGDGSSHSVEHEKFLSAIVAATPLSALRQGAAWRLADSSLSLNSLAHTASQHLSSSSVGPQHMLHQQHYQQHGAPVSAAANTVGLPTSQLSTESSSTVATATTGSPSNTSSITEAGAGNMFSSPMQGSVYSNSSAGVGVDDSTGYNPSWSYPTGVYNSSLNTTYNSSFPNSPYGSSYLQGNHGLDYPTLTPEVARRTNPLSKAFNTLRYDKRAPHSN